MYNFLALLFFELVFQILDYFWSFIGDYFKESGKWKDCQKDLDFWHTVHGLLTYINLSIILVVLRRERNPVLNYSTLLKICIIIQVFSLYWLIQGLIWIEVDLTHNRECMPETPLEVIITYLGGVGLWVLETVLILKCVDIVGLRPVLQEEVIEMIQKLEESDIEQESVCAICLDEVSRGIALPSCRHAYHKECILRWAEFNQTCPYCRTSLQI